MNTAKGRILAGVAGLTLLLTAAGCASARLTKPEFPGMAQASFSLNGVNVRMQVSEPVRETSLPVYRVANRELSESETKKLLDAFGFVNPSVKTESDASDGSRKVYTENDRVLELSAMGNYRFTDKALCADDKKPVMLSDDEAKETARQFLTERGLLPEGFVQEGKGEESLSTGEETIVNKKIVGFFQKINGCPVYGHSEITVSCAADGIAEVYSRYSWPGENPQSMSCLTMAEAQEKILSETSWIEYNESGLNDVDHIEITEAKIAYYDDPGEDFAFLQPCFYFHGTLYDSAGKKTDFTSLVPALKEECYAG